MATIIGTFAALAWLIASTVCGITPSSAATTSTTMSVTLAPRARIAVNAAWPGGLSVGGGVDEGDLVTSFGRVHLIGADMLGDAAGFAGNHVGMAQRVEQRGLAVVDVTHHGHDRRARLGVGGILNGVEQAFLDVGSRHALDRVTQFLGDELRGVGVDHVRDLVHRALLHQQPDDVDGALRHAVGEFLNVDRFRDHDLANQLFLWLVRLMALQALGAAAKRCDRTLADIVGVERGDKRKAAALFLRRRLRGRLGGDHRPAGSTTPNLARTFVFIGDIGRDARRARDGNGRPGRRRGGGGRGAGFGFAKTLLGFKFGLALGFLVVTMALFLGLAAGFGRFAFGLLDAFPAGAALGFFFRNTALFDIAQLGVGQRIGARRTLDLCEGAQDYAGIAARRRRRGGGTSRRCRGRRFGWLGYNRFGRVRLGGTIPADPALAALLHHDLLGPAVAEALAHGSGLDPRLERQGLGRHTERLVARRFRINHSAVLILSSRARSHGL